MMQDKITEIYNSMADFYPLWDIAFVRVFGYSVFEGCKMHP